MNKPPSPAPEKALRGQAPATAAASSEAVDADAARSEVPGSGILSASDEAAAELSKRDLKTGVRENRPEHLASSGMDEAVAHGEPEFVHEIAGPILSHYSLRDGHAHLEGCTLEARPILRLTWSREEVDSPYLYFGPSGHRLTGAEIDQFGLDDIAVVPPKLRNSDRESLEQWVQVAIAAAGTDMGKPNSLVTATWEQLQPTVIWRNWAAGKVRLRFESGASTSIEFEGWAREFLSGERLPPKLKCPSSGMESYRCVCLIDGRITVADALGACQVSGREMLASERVLCEVTGRWIDPDLAVTCQVTQRVAAKESIATCRCCGTAVVPGALQGNLCPACVELPVLDIQSVTTIALLERLHDQYRRLFQSKKLYGSVNSSIAVIETKGLTALHRYVFDVSSARLLREATRSRMSKHWQWTDIGESE